MLFLVYSHLIFGIDMNVLLSVQSTRLLSLMNDLDLKQFCDDILFQDLGYVTLTGALR